jgi:hypothetical protein
MHDPRKGGEQAMGRKSCESFRGVASLAQFPDQAQNEDAQHPGSDVGRVEPDTSFP